mgnify:CR=1 FL=1
MLELGQAQTHNDDEVRARFEAACGAHGVMQQPVHGLHKCVAAPLEHAEHSPVTGIQLKLLRVLPEVSLLFFSADHRAHLARVK